MLGIVLNLANPVEFSAEPDTYTSVVSFPLGVYGYTHLCGFSQHSFNHSFVYPIHLLLSYFFPFHFGCNWGLMCWEWKVRAALSNYTPKYSDITVLHVMACIKSMKATLTYVHLSRMFRGLSVHCGFKRNWAAVTHNTNATCFLSTWGIIGV